jgi:uncharacterized membrane protein
VSAPSSRADGDIPTAGLRRSAQAVYLLHGLALLLGFFGGGLIDGRVVVGVLAVAALCLNYSRRRAARGTVFEWHFAWQIRTFWIAATLLAGATLLFGPLLFVGLPLLWVAYAAVALWVAYRLLKGALALRRGREPR